YINDEYPRYPLCSAASVVEIDPSKSYAEHKNSEKKKLLLTEDNIQFFSIDRENKLFLENVTPELEAKVNHAFSEKISLFKKQRKVLIQDIESKKEKIENLDEEIGLLEKEYGKGNC